jgi:hypothetical protein
MTRLFRFSKLFQGVIDHRGAGCSPGGGMVGALGFRVGPVLFSIAGLGWIVENNIGTCRIFIAKERPRICRKIPLAQFR